MCKKRSLGVLRKKEFYRYQLEYVKYVVSNAEKYSWMMEQELNEMRS